MQKCNLQTFEIHHESSHMSFFASAVAAACDIYAAGILHKFYFLLMIILLKPCAILTLDLIM